MEKQNDVAADGRLSYSVDEVARLAGIGRTSIYADIKSGKLQARKAGRRTLILQEDARAWLRSLPYLNTADAA